MTKEIKNTAVCFGEILWDMLPDGPQPGGAPLNAAYHLNKLGVETSIISRIGNDEQGRKLSGLISEWGIRKDLLQTDTQYPTSEVIATVNENHEVSYEIVYPVAWDFISASPDTAAAGPDYFVYGSLASRNTVSQNALFELLETDAIKVFDINLRPPYYNPDLLEKLLKKADIVKFNQAELDLAISIFRGTSKGEADDALFIRSHFGIAEVIVTRGAHGAAYYSQTETCEIQGHPVKVEDTIGSGDSFLAAFIASHAQHKKPQQIIQNALAMGAFVATKKGGCPDYRIEEYIDFKNQIFNT